MKKRPILSISMIAGSLLYFSTGVTVSFADASAQPAKPAQSAVALKGAFSTIAGNSAVVKSAVNAKDLKAAAALEGKQGVFTGTVTKIYSPSSNSIVVLDFDRDYDTAITAVVKPEAYKAFPNLDQLSGKHVIVSGAVIAYHGRPEVVLTALNQIQVIK